MAPMSDTEHAALHKAVTVPQEPADAFRLFTDDIARWWPLATHSVGLRDAVGLEFPDATGRPIVEHLRNGGTAVWGTVTRWDPPTTVAFTWHPGTPPEEATAVEVTFTACAGGTTVELVHRGWERRPDGRDARTSYDTGWDLVLGGFEARAGA